MIFIPGNVPALKNSKRIIPIGARCPKCRKAMRRIMIPSASVDKWRAATKPFWEKYRQEFLDMLALSEKPYPIKFKFVRDSRRLFDYSNALDTVQDEMVRHKWLEDDNCSVMRPILRTYKYDKLKSGVWISVKI